MTGDAQPPSVQLAAAADRYRNGRPIVTPMFHRGGARGLHITGLDGDDVRQVKVYAEDGDRCVELSDVIDSVEVDAPAHDMVRFRIEGFLTQSPLPQNAERVVAVAGHGIEVTEHACPHVTAFGEVGCRWCGEPISDDEIDMRCIGDVEDVPVYCGGTFHGYECRELDGHDGPHVFHIVGDA